MSILASRGLLALLLPAVLALLCLFGFYNHCLQAIQETFDLGWLIQTGLYIQNHGLPHTDIFSWTQTGRSFTAYQWLSEVAIATLYQCGGFWLIGQTACLTSGLLYFFALPAIWVSLQLRLPVILAMLALVLTPHFFNARPQLFSYFFFLLLIWILELGRPSFKRLSLLIPLFALWVNLHSFWLIGVVIALVYLISWHKIIGAKAVALLSLALSASVLCNPYGIELFQHLLTFLDGSQFLGMGEVQPSWSDPGAFLWFAYLAICLTIIAAGRKNISTPGLLVCLVIATMAVVVRRYQSVWVIVSWLYVGKALAAQSWATIATPMQSKKTVLYLFGCALVLPCLVWSARCPDNLSASNVFYESNQSVLDWYKQLQSKYQGFADPTSGSWLIARGCAPVFIDTRYDMYPKQFCQQVLETLRADAGWLKFIDANKVTMILVRDGFPLFADLESQQDWFPAIDNGRLSIWLRVTGDHPDLKLNQFNLQNSERTPLLSRGMSERIQTAKTRCRWYFKTSGGDITPELSKQKISDALILLPDSSLLKDRWAALNAPLNAPLNTPLTVPGRPK